MPTIRTATLRCPHCDAEVLASVVIIGGRATLIPLNNTVEGDLTAGHTVALAPDGPVILACPNLHQNPA